MRIMCQPNIGLVNASEDGNVTIFYEIIRNMNRMYNNKAWFYLVVPRNVYGLEKFEQFKNVTVLRERRRLQQYFIEADIVSSDILRWFSPADGRYMIDAVLTSKTGAALMLKNLLSDYRFLSDQIEEAAGFPVVIYEDIAWGKRETHQAISAYEFMLRAIGYASLPSFFMSQHEIDAAIEASREYVSPYLMRLIRSNIKLIPWGVSADEIDRVIEGVKKREKFTVFWGGRFSHQKRVDFIVDAFTKFYESGVDAEMVLTTQHTAPFLKLPELEEKVKRNKKVKIYSGISRYEFLKGVASSHVWLSGSLYEGFTAGHCEMGYTGVPGIVPRRPWSKFIFGSDYELMYDALNLEQAVATLRWVYENYDKALEIGAKTRERISRMFRIENFVAGVAEMVEKEYERNVGAICKQYSTGETFKTIEVVAEKLGDEFLFDDFMTEYRRRWGEVPGRIAISFPTKWMMYQLLKKAGYEDLYTSPQPVMRRRRV